MTPQLDYTAGPFKLDDWGIPGLSDETRDKIMAALDEARQDDFTLPRLNLSPIDPIDAAAQEMWPGKTDSEIAAIQAAEAKPGTFKEKGDAYTAAQQARIPQAKAPSKPKPSASPTTAK